MKLLKGQTQASLLEGKPCGPAALAGERRAGGADRGLRPRKGGDPPRPEAGQRHGGSVRRGAGDGPGVGQGVGRGGIADEERASRQHQPEGTQIRTARNIGSGSYTKAGSLLGTPAYMPSEQANGDIAHLDRRSTLVTYGMVFSSS
jgi:hypothetical protein